MNTSARGGSRKPGRVFCPLGSRCPDGATMHDPDSAVYKDHVKMAAGLSRSRAVSASRGLNPRTKHGLATNAHKIDMWKSTGRKDLLDVDMKSYVDDELNVVVTREDTGDSMVLGKEKELELANIYDIEFGSAHDYVLLAEMIHGDDEIQSRLDSYLEDEYEDDPVLVDAVRLSAVARGSEDDVSELSGGEHPDMMKSLHDYAKDQGLDLTDESDLRKSYRGFGNYYVDNYGFATDGFRVDNEELAGGGSFVTFTAASDYSDTTRDVTVRLKEGERPEDLIDADVATKMVEQAMGSSMWPSMMGGAAAYALREYGAEPEDRSKIFDRRNEVTKAWVDDMTRRIVVENVRASYPAFSGRTEE